MSITDELREYAHDCCAMVDDAIHGIADRIDERHKHAIGYVDDRDPETMAENGWVRLPKDADGEYIHVGDVMEWPDGKTFEVVGIGDGTLFYVEGDDDALADWTGASTKRHHHAPTVEDVLTEMLEQAVGYSDAHATVALNTIAEYAAKLRLAEGEDE